MLQDLGYAQTDMVPFGRKPDEPVIPHLILLFSVLDGDRPF